MEDKIVDELHKLELELKKLGFKSSVIEPVMHAVEAESFALLKESLADERVSNYFRFLNNKLGVISHQFINKRKSDSSSQPWIWRNRANFQKSRIEGVMPDTDVSRALKFLIDKSFEL